LARKAKVPTGEGPLEGLAMQAGVGAGLDAVRAGAVGAAAPKKAVIRGLSLRLADGLRLEAMLTGTLQGTEDAAEGPRAFAEKRKRRFKAQ
jgi:E-phenylitaconyl-CoA hydratase